MFQWMGVEDQEVQEMTCKMYREPFAYEKTHSVPVAADELDDVAYKFFGTELDTYKVLDANFTEYIENRGDMSQLTSFLLGSELSEQGVL